MRHKIFSQLKWHFTIWAFAFLLTGALLASPQTAVAQAAEPETHEVQAGETLFRISQMYDVSVVNLREWNELEDNTIWPGQELFVEEPAPGAEPPEPPETPADTLAAEEPEEEPQREPVEPEPEEPPQEETPEEETGIEVIPEEDEEEAAPDAEQPRDTASPVDDMEGGPFGWHEIEPGETLHEIAARWSVSVDTLRALNPELSLYLSEGDHLRLPSSKAGFVHEVEEGESLVDVAAQYGVSVRGLAQFNNLEDRAVSVGQQLFIPGREAPQPTGRGALPSPDLVGSITVFPAAYAGRVTASGEEYDPDALVASHPTLPMGSVVLLSRPDNEAHVFARIIDRSPESVEQLMEVSQAIADELDLDGEEADVEVRIADEGQ